MNRDNVNQYQYHKYYNYLSRFLSIKTTLLTALIYAFSYSVNLDCFMAIASKYQNISHLDTNIPQKSSDSFRTSRSFDQLFRSSTQKITEIIIIDSAVEEPETLIKNLAENISVYYLDSRKDGVEQIAKISSHHQNLKAIHILAHGNIGQLNLGSGILNIQKLQSQAEALRKWGESLTIDGDILFYGCNLAQEKVGQTLVESLSKLTNADIAASNDLTGNPALGGDWDLEITKGKIESHSALDYFSQSNYQRVLQVANPDLPSNFCNEQVDLIFVLDESGSVSRFGVNGNPSEIELQRQSVRDTLLYLVNNNINARAAIIAFDTSARTLTSENGQNYIQVNANTIASGGALESAIQEYGSGSGFGNLTNWEAGFAEALSVDAGTSNYPDSLFFFTDGIQNNGISAEDEANTFKTKGTHIYTISIGNAVSLANLADLTDGANAATYVLDPPNPVPADHVDVANYNDLSSDFLNVFQDACLQKASLNKEFDADTIVPTEVSTLTFTITNIDGNPLREEIYFTDEFPENISIADDAASSITNTCNGTLINSSGEEIGIDDTGITLINGSLASGVASCTISVQVTSLIDVDLATIYTNDSDNISDRNNICLEDCDNPNAPNDFIATLTVNPFPISSLAGDVIINEVLYRGIAAGSSNDEFIELFNTSGTSIDLTNLKLADGNLLATDHPDADDGNFINGAKFYTFGNGTDELGNLILQPGEYAVIWIGEQNNNNNASGATFQAWLNQTPKLRNRGDDVWLYDTDTSVIDYVAYGSNSVNIRSVNIRPDPDFWDQWDSSDETSLAGASSGQSISLTPNGIDGNTSVCWEKTTSNGADDNTCDNYLTTIDSDASTIGTTEHITSVGGNNNGQANLILVKRITNVTPNRQNLDFGTVVNDDDQNGFDDDPKWETNYLQGQTDLEGIEPGDEIEYTIYFLANGSKDVDNFRLCDVIPDNMSFVRDSFGGNTGISLSLENVTTSLSNNVFDSDQGKFYEPNTLPPNFCQKIDQSDNLVTVDDNNNINGSVVVNLENTIPFAESSGIPNNSFGYIRFRVTVK